MPDGVQCYQVSCPPPGNKEFKLTMGGVELASVEEEKDVGVMIHHTLRPSLQCAKASARANQVLGQLARGVGYRDGPPSSSCTVCT